MRGFAIWTSFLWILASQTLTASASQQQVDYQNDRVVLSKSEYIQLLEAQRTLADARCSFVCPPYSVMHQDREIENVESASNDETESRNSTNSNNGKKKKDPEPLDPVEYWTIMTFIFFLVILGGMFAGKFFDLKWESVIANRWYSFIGLTIGLMSLG
jgi:hypothetical protein